MCGYVSVGDVHVWVCEYGDVHVYVCECWGVVYVCEGGQASGKHGQ